MTKETRNSETLKYFQQRRGETRIREYLAIGCYTCSIVYNLLITGDRRNLMF